MISAEEPIHVQSSVWKGPFNVVQVSDAICTALCLNRTAWGSNDNNKGSP